MDFEQAMANRRPASMSIEDAAYTASASQPSERARARESRRVLQILQSLGARRRAEV
jgi:hypothetical protein